MASKRFLRRLFGRAAAKPVRPPAENHVAPAEMMEKLVTMLDRTTPVEMSCDEVFSLLDQFAELAARGEDVAKLMPLVKQHLEMCADCREEYQVLARILDNSA